VDPQALSQTDWSETGRLIALIIGFALAVITFAGSMLLAHAIIPSLVNSGQVPRKFVDKVQELRPMLYMGALAGFTAMVVLMVFIQHDARVIRNFWERWWI